MNKTPLVLTVLLFVCPHLLVAQSPPIDWQKCYGGNYQDIGKYIEPTSDGGYIMVSTTQGSGGDVSGFHGGLGDIWVVKMDQAGAIQWSKSLGGSGLEDGAVVHQTPDGSFVVAGTANSPMGDGTVTAASKGGLDFWLLKLSSTGTILWQNRYGGSVDETLYDMKLTPDGGYILAGITASNNGDVSQNTNYGRDAIGWVIKVNSSGNKQWDQMVPPFQGTGVSARSITPFTSGYIYAAYTLPISYYPNSEIITGTLDLNGNRVGSVPGVWDQRIGTSSDDYAYSVINTSDGGFLLVGYTASTSLASNGNHGDMDVYVLKMDISGNQLWSHCYGGSSKDMAFNVSATADGGYLIAGSTSSKDGDVSGNTSTTQAGWVFKISATGCMIWQKVLTGGIWDQLANAVETPDGGAIVSGYTQQSNIPGYHTDLSTAPYLGDAFVVKLGPLSAATSLVISTPPSNICSGSPVTLTANTTGAPPGVTYKWFVNGADVNNSSPSYTNSGFANGDQVYCQQFNTTGCTVTPVTSNTVVLSINATQAPNITISADNSTVCTGSQVSFKAVVTGGTSGAAFQWLLNGSPVGSGGDTYRSTTLADGDLVSCTYSDNTSCVTPGPNTSNSLPLQILPIGTPSISITASDTKVCEGVMVNFQATPVNGGTTPGYQWLVNGLPVLGVIGPVYSNPSPSDGDMVECKLTSTAACSSPAPVQSNQIDISVTPKKVLSLNVDYTFPVCSGQPVVFTARSDNALNPSYQWLVNGTATGSSRTYTAASVNNGDNISCILSEASECTPPVTFSVIPGVYPTPVIGTVAPVVLNKGQSTLLDLPVSGDIATYVWSPSTGLSDAATADPLAAPLRSTDYRLEVVSKDGCSASGDVKVNVTSRMAIPGAFTPNGDGHNDIFYVVGGPLGSVIKDFAVFDRVGRCVFQVHGVAPDDPAFGWDGRVAGQPMAPGTYVYEVLISFADKTQQIFKGTVVLIR